MNAFAAQTLPDPLPAEPLKLARAWLEQATRERVQPNPNAIVLATVDAAGRPSSRVLLCKEIAAPPGYLVFYTNYQSRKGEELAASPRAAALFYWDTLHRQVRVEGPVLKSPAGESDGYFASRPWQSRVGAWASAQSRPVGSRAELVAALKAAGQRFHTPPIGPGSVADPGATVEVPRPPHWGGYRLWAESVELWVEGEFRIHDRARFTRTLTPSADGAAFTFTPWRGERLQP